MKKGLILDSNGDLTKKGIVFVVLISIAASLFIDFLINTLRDRIEYEKYVEEYNATISQIVEFNESAGVGKI